MFDLATHLLGRFAGQPPAPPYPVPAQAPPARIPTWSPPPMPILPGPGFFAALNPAMQAFGPPPRPLFYTPFFVGR